VEAENCQSQEINMNTISSKLTSLIAALVINGLIMSSVAYLFAVQSHPHLSLFAFAHQVASRTLII
jgi:hypothetical protein